MPGLSETVAAIIAKMTACDRDERFMSWQEVLENVRAISSPDTETIPAIKLPPKKKTAEEFQISKKWKKLKPSHKKTDTVKAKCATGIDLASVNKTGIYNAKSTDVGKTWPFSRKSTIVMLIVLIFISGLGCYLLLKAAEYRKVRNINAQKKLEQEQAILMAAQTRNLQEKQEKAKLSFKDALAKAKYAIKKAQDRPEILDAYIGKLENALAGTGYEKEFSDEVEKMRFSAGNDTEKNIIREPSEPKLDKFTKVMRKIAGYLLAGNTGAAVEDLVSIKNDADLQQHRKFIENTISTILKLKNADRLIAASFQEEKGNTVKINTTLEKGEIRGKLIEVNPNGIIIQDEEGEQTVLRSDDLSMTEKLKRLKAEGDEFGKFYAVVSLLRTGKALEANESYIKDSSNPLFEAMLLKSQKEE